MKSTLLVVVAFVLCVGSVSAQKVELTKRLVQDEVPVLVLQSLQKDFASLPEKGTWKMVYFEDLNTKKFTPAFYTYSCKNNGERVEIFFKPDGTLDHAKGIDAPASSEQK